MISLDYILDTALSILKSQFPEALTQGFIIKNADIYNPETNSTEKSTDKLAVEIIPEKLTIEEIQASGILQTDLKLHIIGNKAYDVSFNKLIEIDSNVYRVKQIIDSVVGTKTAIWTVICSKK